VTEVSEAAFALLGLKKLSESSPYISLT